jgi:hypothetical protein
MAHAILDKVPTSALADAGGDGEPALDPVAVVHIRRVLAGSRLQTTLKPQRR